MNNVGQDVVGNWTTRQKVKLQEEGVNFEQWARCYWTYIDLQICRSRTPPGQDKYSETTLPAETTTSNGQPGSKGVMNPEEKGKPEGWTQILWIDRDVKHAKGIEFQGKVGHNP